MRGYIKWDSDWNSSACYPQTKSPNPHHPHPTINTSAPTSYTPIHYRWHKNCKNTSIPYLLLVISPTGPPPVLPCTKWSGPPPFLVHYHAHHKMKPHSRYWGRPINEIQLVGLWPPPPPLHHSHGNTVNIHLLIYLQQKSYLSSAINNLIFLYLLTGCMDDAHSLVRQCYTVF